MVSMRDRALIEARAKGLTEEDIAAALRQPFRQLMKPDVIISVHRRVDHAADLLHLGRRSA